MSDETFKPCPKCGVGRIYHGAFCKPTLAAKPHNQEIMTTPAIQRLEAWMKEITDLLCYQPEIPVAHKTEICNALHAFQKEIEAAPMCVPIAQPEGGAK